MENMILKFFGRKMIFNRKFLWLELGENVVVEIGLFRIG